MQTPNFQGVKYWKRLQWAKDNLNPFSTEYCVVYEEDIDEPAKIMHPDPNWMAAALQGGIVPPIETVLALKEDEKRPDFKKHTLGSKRDAAKPCDAMTEEDAVEYQIMQSLPKEVWSSWNEGNYPKMVICKKDQLPKTRLWRNTWKINTELEIE